MEKSIYDFVTYRMYRYAPESFSIHIKNLELGLNSNVTHDFGLTLIQHGKEEVMKEIKRYFRKNTSLGENFVSRRVLCLVDTEGNKYYIKEFGKVERYDMKSKLECYKILKRLLLEDGYFISKVTLNGDYKTVNEEKEFMKDKKNIVRIAFV